jgi:Tol biopolymer transport system component
MDLLNTSLLFLKQLSKRMHLNLFSFSNFKKIIMTSLLLISSIAVFQNCASKDSVPTACTSLECTAKKYSLFVADLDGSNLSLVKTSSYQEMTHPRVSSDKEWVSYTFYNDLDANNCASLSKGYFNTEIRAVRLSGIDDKQIIAPVANEFNSNNYWIGSTNEFSYLSGPVTALKFFRATVDSTMNLVSGPTQIPVVGTILPLDPQTHLASNHIVFPGLYNPGGGFIKSIFMMNLSDSTNLVGLSVGRDRAGTPIICATAECTNIMENDPKISPDGSKVAFMRQAPDSGSNGFGWHIFVVPVASPQTEVDISYSHIGSDVLKNDVLPEWLDDNTLIFSTIEIISSSEFVKNVYTMKSDGTERSKISLPEGFLYADVFPFTDTNAKKRMVIAAEKIGASCSQ